MLAEEDSFALPLDGGPVLMKSTWSSTSGVNIFDHVGKE
jgi:hypothetical protein